MGQTLTFDYCIVGAGIAGLLVASRLAKTGKSILIIDQGPDLDNARRDALRAQAITDLNYELDYEDDLGSRWVTPTSPDGGTQADRLFGFGGTAAHFGGWMVRPLADDLKVRSRFGYGHDWPIGLDELEPWLSAAEHEVGVAVGDDNPYVDPLRSRPAPMPAHAFSYFDREIFGPGLSALGMQGHSNAVAVASEAYETDHGPRLACAGCRFCRYCPTGARYSPDRVHGAWLKKQPNVEIRTGVTLRRLLLNPTGSRVVSGRALDVESGDELKIEAGEFVLAMGGVATTRMLLLSQGAGPHKSGIGNENELVGAKLGDHFGSIGLMELDRHAGARLGFATMQCDYGRLNVDRTQEPTWILIGAPMANDFPLLSMAVQMSSRGDRLDLAKLRTALPRMAWFYAMFENSTSGTLTLDSSTTDAYGDPLARMDHAPTDWDKRAGKNFKEMMERLRVAIKGVKIECTDPFTMGGHPSGTTPMGADREVGVCDPDLKVFATDNLHLCSVSTFPHLGANPPTLTLAALALRLGEHLASKA